MKVSFLLQCGINLDSLSLSRSSLPPNQDQGDLHAIGSGMITRSGTLNFDNPIHTMLAGPIGTGTGWLSSARGIGSTIPTGVEVEERVHPLEDNGSSILDTDQDSIEVKQFAWLPVLGVDVIDSLQPFSTFKLSRRGSSSLLPC